MSLHIFMFCLLSAVIIVFSVLSVLSRRILRSAVFLLFVLIATAGLYFMLNYQFLAGVQLTIYAGGIVVLIIFSILLTSHISYKFEKPGKWIVLSGALVSVTGIIITIWSILSFQFKATENLPISNDMKTIGRQLIENGKNGYALPFEIISLLLLAAMIGSIIIARKDTNLKNNNN
jgi:NADH-quinone oxidoreductase subunit J